MRNRLPMTGIAMMGVAAVLFLGAFQVGTARAANLPYSLSITPFAGGYVFEGNQKRQDKPVYGISVGYNFTGNWAVELTGSAVFDSFSSKKSWDIYGVRGDLLYHFLPEGRFVPYLAAGGGALLLKPNGGSSDGDFIADYGGGFKFFLTDLIALRADVRHIIDFTYHDTAAKRDLYNNFAYTAGVTFQIGGVKPAARVVEEQKPVQAVTPPPPATEETKPEPTPVPAPTPAPIEAPLPAPVPEAPLTLTAEKPELAAAATAGTIVLTGITIDKDSLEIVTSKHLGAYKTYTLSQPSRLVIDVADAVNALGVKRIPVHRFGITAVRFGTHPDFLRIVLDAAQGKLLPYRIEETGKGLKIIMTNP
jgi:outer membrane beta-barrel protein